MQVKKFEAPTIQEALKVIKQEMGPDAIILSTKENKKGFGLMKKGSVEVTAAISKKDLQKKTMAERLLPEETKQKIWESKASTQKEIYDDYFDKQLRQSEGTKTQLSSAAKSMPPKRGPDLISPDILRTNSPPKAREVVREPEREVVHVDNSADVKVLERELSDLRQLVKHIANSRAGLTDSAESGGQTEELTDAYLQLVNAGIEKRLARDLIKRADFELSSLEKRNSSVIQEKLASALMEQVHVTDCLKNVGAAAGVANTKYLAVVGPTGVGKTTTVAKIASLSLMEKKMRVGLINLDSYRVAAADQLATYAKLMNCPFRSVTNASELQQAIHDFGSLDLVIIDTTGRSQKDQPSLIEMRSLLNSVKDLTTLLTISATTRESDINDIVSRFKIFAPEAMVFSKLDETSVYGQIFNAHVRTGVPLAFFTVGQRVPEDIERASAERLADLILDL